MAVLSEGCEAPKRLISLLTVPALKSANAALVSPSSPAFGDNGYWQAHVAAGPALRAATPPRRRWARWSRASSFDHLVGAGEERRRKLKAERLRGGQIDNQLELGRLLVRQYKRVSTQDYRDRRKDNSRCKLRDL